MTDSKPPEEDKIKIKLDALALAIADEAKNEPNFGNKLDAFKALTAYHLGIVKIAKKKSGEDDPTEKGETFDGYRKSIEASGG